MSLVPLWHRTSKPSPESSFSAPAVDTARTSPRATRRLPCAFRMPLPKQTAQQPPNSPQTAQHMQTAPRRRTPLHVCLPHPWGFCMDHAWDGKTGNPPPLHSPTVHWEERRGGGKAWPGLPATLQNSFKASDVKGSCGNAWLFGFTQLWSLPALPVRKDNPARCHLPARDGNRPLQPPAALLRRLNIHIFPPASPKRES